MALAGGATRPPVGGFRRVSRKVERMPVMSGYQDMSFVWTVNGDELRWGTADDYAFDMLIGVKPGQVSFFDPVFGEVGWVITSAHEHAPHPGYRVACVRFEANSTKRHVVREGCSTVDAES